jgi:putative membrane protein
VATRLQASVLLLAALATVTGCATGPSASKESNSTYDQPYETVDTPFGPLNASDRDLIIKVRQAGLWEIPAGQEAQSRAGSDRVREVGNMIMNEHVELDKATIQIADQLGVNLPNQPNQDQVNWLNEMNAAPTPQQWDFVFANRLRIAHGAIFVGIANVRAGTRNSLVRQFSEVANQAVLRHQTYLESTGVVDHFGIPEAPDPRLPNPVAIAANPNSAYGTAPEGMGPTDIVVVLVVAFGSVVATLGGIWLVRGGNTRKRARSGGRRQPDAGELLADRF